MYIDPDKVMYIAAPAIVSPELAQAAQDTLTRKRAGIPPWSMSASCRRSPFQRWRKPV